MGSEQEHAEHRCATRDAAKGPVRLALMGDGRMGKLIRATAQGMLDEDGLPVFEVVAQVGFDLALAETAPAADVLVDFSNAATLPAVIAYVRRTKAALVSGTTGYDEDQQAALRALAKVAAVLHAGNYSLGVAALRHATALVARELAGFDVEITETHHNQKVDAPSGTARMLLDTVVDAKAETGHEACYPVYGREGMVGPRDPREVGMHSLRGGTVAGVHTVSFFGVDEEVTLLHRATSRQIFVDGALVAARRMAGRPAGLLTFDEVMFGA